MLTRKDVVWLEKLEKILENQDIRPDADSLLAIYSGLQEIFVNSYAEIGLYEEIGNLLKEYEK